MTLKWGSNSELFIRPNVITRVLKTTEAEVGVKIIIDFEDECAVKGGSVKSQTSNILWMERKWLPPWILQKECSQAHTLILAQWDPFQTPDLQNSNRIDLCCFKPLNFSGEPASFSPTLPAYVPSLTLCQINK